MAPQACLTFTPSSAPILPAPFDLSSLNSFALWPSSASPANPTRHTAHLVPSRPVLGTLPTVQITGNFSLEKGGGVQVGAVKVRIERGTFVGRCEGMGEDGNESKGLWWMGQGSQGEIGVWELQLLRATYADALAVHRLLLYLPPARPRPRSPPQQVPAYRNSLLLYDEHHQQIVSVPPLDKQSPTARRPRRGPLPPLPTSKPLPLPPRPLSPGAHLARYIDRVVEGIFPDPTPDALSAAERLEQAKIVREAAKEEKEWDPFHLGDILLAVPLTRSTAESLEQEPMEEEEKKEGSENPRSLKSEPATLPSSSSTSKAGSTHSKAAPSEWSVSSFATFGSDRFVTADEFEDATESSRRNSFTAIVEGSEDSTFASTIREAQEETSDLGRSEEQGESTPTPTRLVNARSATVPHDIVQSPVDLFISTQSHSPVLDPFDTLTNGNAVLLSFLGASSIAPSSTHRIKVSAHPLSTDQLREQIDAGTIKAAEFIGDGEEEKGWLNWLTSLLRTGSEDKVDGIAESMTKGWLGWLPWNWGEETSGSSAMPSDPVQAGEVREAHLPSSSSKRTTSAAGSEMPSSSRNPVRRAVGASGESSARLSVIYVDGEGRGSRAFVGKG